MKVNSKPDWAQVDTRPVTIPHETHRKRSLRRGCFTLLLAMLILLVIYFLLPLRSTFLILGLDTREPEDYLGRSDTMILVSVVPLRPDVRMLSIPRDLWVPVPGYGENRINAAHFFGEAENFGSGPTLAMETIRENFRIDVEWYVRVRFSGFVDIVDSLGGVTIVLPEPMSGYSQGEHHLDGSQALAFVRDRSGTDDFFRMARGQIFIDAIWKQILLPSTLGKMPKIFLAVSQVMETNIPIWYLPRIGLALLRSGPGGIEANVISREMVTPFTTQGGAYVLMPNWNSIDPVVNQLFE